MLVDGKTIRGDTNEASAKLKARHSRWSALQMSLAQDITAKSISIVPFKKYTWFGLMKFMSGVHK